MDKTIRFESRLTRFRHCFPSGKEYSIVGRKKKKNWNETNQRTGYFDRGIKVALTPARGTKGEASITVGARFGGRSVKIFEKSRFVIVYCDRGFGWNSAAPPVAHREWDLKGREEWNVGSYR